VVVDEEDKARSLIQGFHRSLKVVDFFLIFQAWKVLENRPGP